MTLDSEKTILDYQARILDLSERLEQRGQIKLSEDLQQRYASLKEDYVLNLQNLIKMFEKRIEQ